MNDNYFLTLSQQVATGEVSVSAAFEQVKKLPKPWETAEWKTRRAEVLGPCCEKCGSGTPPLVVFNRALPLFYGELKTLLCNELSIACYRDVFDSIGEAEAEAAMRVDPSPRDSCPKCGILTIRARKNINPRYLCARGHGFELPVARTYYPAAKTTDKTVALDAARSYLTGVKINAALKENDAEITQLALVESLRQSAEYVRLDQVNTLCRRCHFQARAEEIANKEWRIPLVPLINRFQLRKT